ncbi:hypothetical protein KUD11_04405 [Roseovarius sp. LXJ103]|uniref:hypothetical protein n=1 Tax=Roseovarius carneus TaxID=2853164 RepID=UPI0011B292F1|nr:hypothetical protein [Roseovarius carneus]MBZ8117882.1 hypothetical protein [Roseovarius carneus]
MTLYDLIIPMLAVACAVSGLALLAFAVRLGMGSGEAYDQLRGVSKGFRDTMFGNIHQPYGKGGTLFNRGTAYSIDQKGNIELISQAKTNRESVQDASF